MRKYVLYRVLPLTLLALAGCGESPKKSPAAMGSGEKNKPLKVDLYIVQPTRYAETVEVPGTIVANESVEIHPEVQILDALETFAGSDQGLVQMEDI